jgi:nitrogen regulatory protein P-II 1
VKLVVAVIKPHMLDEVKSALEATGISGMTVTDVRGFGRQRGQTETYRGSEYTVDFLPKLKLEVLVEDEYAMDVADELMLAARTGSIGDGKVWVVPVEHLARIRTAELGVEAL